MGGVGADWAKTDKGPNPISETNINIVTNAFFKNFNIKIYPFKHFVSCLLYLVSCILSLTTIFLPDPAGLPFCISRIESSRQEPDKIQPV